MLSSLPDLRDCLTNTTWRRLLAMARLHGLHASTRTHKAALVQLLATYLGRTDVVLHIVRQLDLPSRRALRALLDADGRLPTHLFHSHFGLLRPHRPWSPQEPRQPPPWQQPVSTTERLWYLGLIFQMATPSQGRTLLHYAVPAEFAAPLTAALFDTRTHKPLTQRPAPAALDGEMTLLLAWCQAKPVRPLHGRWLPPSTIWAIGRRLGSPAISEQELQPRSERHVPYLAFLHYLAETTGFLNTLGDLLKPTPAAWQWAEMDTASRLRTLYLAWVPEEATAADRWRAYGFPFAWHRDPLAVARSVLDTLRLPELDRWQPAEQIWEHWWGRSGIALLNGYVLEDNGRAPFFDLLQGPCSWLGFLQLACDPEDQLYLQRTPQGDWLLALPDSAPPSQMETRPCHWHSDGTIIVPATAAPLHLLRLASYAQWDESPDADGSQRLRLTEASIASAVAAGFPLAMIREHLETACAQPVSRRWWTRLRRWAALAARYRIHRLTLLEADQPQHLAELRRRRAFRRCWGEPVSPRAIQVKPDRLSQLLDGLRNLGAYPRVELAPAEAAARSASLPQHATLWLAVEVYRRLAEYLPLPAPLSGDILDAIAAGLSDAQLEAATLYADQVLDDLERVIEGYLHYPAGEHRGDPKAISPLIEQAIAEGKDLDIVYWSAGRGQQTTRHVTPYWIEERNSVPYLIAYCHSRQAQRVFRLDRIEAASIIGDSMPPAGLIDS
ncbi:MAG: WYL domain-containing protein [Anaerolineae bacterium]|nr:WYL domain-containing protein [Anaerolineae bacterium]